MGDNSFGQLNVPVDLTNGMAVAAGDLHSLAVSGTQAPTMMIQPLGRSVYSGTWFSLHARAIVSPPLAYQWLRNGTNMAGETNRFLVFRNIQGSNAGIYSVSVSNSLGGVSSSNATVTVIDSVPVVVAQPVDQSAVIRTSIVFQVTAEGSMPQVYQWRFNGANIAGATNTTLTLDVVVTNQAGLYSVSISNTFGVTVSSNAALTVIGLPPIVSIPPAGQTVRSAVTVSFDATTAGSPPLFHQWLFNGVAIPNATNTSYSITNCTLANAGDYSLLVSNLFGVETSAAALVVLPVAGWGDNTYGQLNIPSSSTNLISLKAGVYHAAAVKADGGVVAWGANTYGQANVPAGATNVASLVVGGMHNLAGQNDGSLTVWGAGLINSGTPPNYGQLILPPLTNVIALAAGGYHTLAAQTSGAVLAWGRNDDGQTNVPAGLTNITSVAGGGLHSLALNVFGGLTAWGRNSSGQGSVPPGTTNIVAVAAGYSHNLALKGDGTILAWGANGAGQVNVPASATNVIAVAAGGNLSAALRGDGVVIGWGSVTAPAGLTNVVALTAGTNFCLALIRTDAPPAITGQLVSRTNYVGTTAVFRAFATGSGVLNYQWQFENADIPGETNVLFQVASVQMTNAGSYRVVVSNAFGIAISAPAALIPIEQPPFFLSQPTNIATFRYGAAAFSASANGSPLLRYQWKFAGVDILGATNPVLSLSNLAPAAAGIYSVTVSNDYDGIISTNATLTLVNVAAWGLNSSGQTTVPITLTNTIGIAAGQTHSLALLPERTVVGWGNNGSGRATPPTDATNVVALVGGGTFSLGLKAGGLVRGWGATVVSNVPASISNVTQLAGTLATILGEHALALRADGTVTGWGDPGYTALPPPTGLSNIVGVAPGVAQNLVLRDDGTVFGWAIGGPGYTGISNAPASLTNVVAIAAGTYHFLALRDNGTVVAWGNTAANSLVTNIPNGLSNVVAIAAGVAHNLALKKDGSVVAWGDSTSGKTTIPAGLTNVIAIDAGEFHNVVLIGDGAPVITTHPFNEFRFTGTSAKFTVMVAGQQPLGYRWQFNGADIINGTNAQLAVDNLRLTNAGSYVVIVSNALGSATSTVAQLTVVVRAPFFIVHPTNTSSVSDNANLTATAFGAQPLAYRWFKGYTLVTNDARVSGATTSTLLLTNLQNNDSGWYRAEATNEDGSGTSMSALLLAGPRSVAQWGSTTFNKAQVPNSLTNVSSLAAGSDHCLALRTDGTVVGWGNNNSGQAAVPAGATNVTAVSARGQHSLALRANGAVLSWGQTYTGFPTLSSIVAIGAGTTHGIALRADGTVAAWGSSSVQTNVPAGLSDVMAISCGDSHSLALKRDGTVVAWGDNSSGQTNVVAGATNVTAIAAGGVHSVVLRKNGTVVAWGGSGNSSVPVGLSNVVAISAGNNFSVAVKADGTMAFWGTTGVATQLPAGLSNVLNVASGTSFNLALVGDSGPVIFLQPASQSTAAGGAVSFSVFASGSAVLNYQWLHAGTNLVDGTNASLNLSNVPVLAAGSYACVVSNALGAILSSNATLTVSRSPLQFATGPDALLMTNGGLQMQITGLAGAGTVMVLASTNLVEWSPIFTNPPFVGTLDFLDLDSTNYPARYYRGAEVP